MRTILAVVIVGVTAGALLTAQSRTPAEKAYDEAVYVEQVKGDPKAAIEMYKKISDSKDPAIAVKALLGMADAYRKLGDAEAGKIYQRIVKDFGGQPDAVAEARTRLGSLQTASTATSGVVMREISVTDGGIMAVSSDGHYAYGPMGIQDLFRGTSRRLETGTSSESAADDPTFSKDGKHLAYVMDGFRASAGQLQFEYELRVVDTDTAPGVHQYKTLFKDSNVGALWAHDWTPDDKWVVVSLRRKNGNTKEIGMISAANGSYRHLKSIDSKTPSDWRLFVNPADSRYIAFDLPDDGTGRLLDVFVLAVDGNSQETTRLVSDPTDDRVVGWSPDGRYLIFSSRQTSGETDLRALPFASGKATGAATVVRGNIGAFNPLGITRSGALYYTVPPSPARFRVANFDLSNERLEPSSVTASSEIVGLPGQFSPDGRYIAYISSSTLRIRSVEPPLIVREFGRALDSIGDLGWSLDGLTLVARGTDSKGQAGIYQIDAATGRTSLLIADCGCLFPAWSPNGESLYFLRTLRTADPTMFVRDLASGNEREIVKGVRAFGLSPDGQFIAIELSGKVAVIPASGGQPRELVGGNFRGWTPDSRAMFVAALGGAYLVSLDGAPRKIEGLSGTFVVSPDGRRIALPVGSTVGWRGKPAPIHVLANFLPSPDVPKRDTVRRSDGSIGQLTWVDRTGKTIENVGPRAEYIWRFYSARALSPDGKRLAIPRPGTEGDDLWILELGRGTMTRLASDIQAKDGSLAWSPDSSRIAFVRQRGGQIGLWVKRVDGTSKEALLWEMPNSIWGPTWSSDGTLIVVGVTTLRTNLSSDYDHWAVPLTGDRKPFPLPWNTQYNEGLAEISPDGRWIALNSNREGRTAEDYRIYIRSFPDGEREWVVPDGSGVRPAWRNDGKELYFRSGESLRAIEVWVNGSTVQFRVPEVLGVPSDALVLDGKRFLVLKETTEPKR